MTHVPKEVTDRLHRWGEKDEPYTDYEERFTDVCDQDSGYQYFYDPKTGKTYEAQLVLRLDEVDPPAEDVCPSCGETTYADPDTEGGMLCDLCGWSTSGIRRCARCGTGDPKQLVKGDGVCKKCRE